METLSLLFRVMADALPSGPTLGLLLVILLYLLYRRTRFTLLFIFTFACFWSGIQFSVNEQLKVQSNVAWTFVCALLGFVGVIYGIYVFTQGES
ncbi:MAG TPA: hypothetical protein PKH07_14640 [bacterium]|nr:hypothetical protein [bacterium]